MERSWSGLEVAGAEHLGFRNYIVHGCEDGRWCVLRDENGNAVMSVIIATLNGLSRTYCLKTNKGLQLLLFKETIIPVRCGRWKTTR